MTATPQQPRRAASKIGNVDDFQNKGYKNTAFAIAEIIDNSIQAGATKVDIVIVNNTQNSGEIDEILIIDNGEGMNYDIFSNALVENAGSRSGSARGLGKYGQGLPNASASQTKRVEVYTYQKGQILFNYKDLDEMVAKGDGFLPDIEPRTTIDIDIIKKEKIQIGENGTIVRWYKPNKLSPKRGRALTEQVEKEAGRLFRYFLNGFTDDKGKKIKCDIQILVYDFNSKSYSLNKDLSKKIKAFDPMFLMQETQMNEMFQVNSHPTSEVPDIPGGHGTVEKDFKVQVLKDGRVVEETTRVEVQFSHVKAKERFVHGDRAGLTSFGDIYLHRNMIHRRGYHNISIVRERREIDSGHFGFITDVSKQTNRWWSVEIRVQPIIDRVIGIDSKKQFATNIRFIDQKADNDEHEILTWISSTVKNGVARLEEIIDLQGVGRKKGKPNTPGETEPLGPTEPPPPDDEGSSVTDKDKKDLYEWLKKKYKDLSDKEIKEKVEWAFSIRDKFIFITSDLGDTTLYSWDNFHKVILIEINRNHSFYKKFMESIEDDETKIRSIRLLICSLVESELRNPTADKQINSYLKKFKNRAFEVLEDYIDDLYHNS